MTVQRTSDVYARLYHYTTMQGLLGILKTQQLWATHCQFLNDYSEMMLFRNKLIKHLQPHVTQVYETLAREYPHASDKIKAHGGAEAVGTRNSEIAVDAMYKATTDDFYIVSFCGEHNEDHYINANGLLSQWRGYGGDGGFALVLRTRDLEALLEKEIDALNYRTIHLADVLYSDDEEKLANEFGDDLQIIADYSRHMFMQMRSQDKEPPEVSQCYHAFIRCIARYKHRGFAEEKEVRIVASADLQKKGVSARQKRK